MKFGYARVSKSDQNIDLQIDALNSFGVDEIFEEKISSRVANRPMLQAVMNKLRSGDTLVVWKLDRLGRTVKELIKMIEDFEKNEINFISIQENLDTTTATGKFVFHIFCAAAQMERDINAERTKAGLSAAKARGRVGGRPAADKAMVERALKMYNTNNFSITEISKATNLSRATIYKYIKEKL